MSFYRVSLPRYANGVYSFVNIYKNARLRRVTANPRMALHLLDLQKMPYIAYNHGTSLLLADLKICYGKKRLV
ncbi:uncharacterized protein HfgLR_20750 (plasmid) [Haloferax gibbonsii]|uniref:Uncharacterized protein n=1 Tax=Haloferax gibbonsii TaxID=35746 RepID=A0A871BKS3_HALGI|nr:uncharacterized protein HfgLR_20750 [Haloferax gibbonsii]